MAETPAAGRRRWVTGLLPGAGILINCFDRVNISVAARQLEKEFGRTPAPTDDAGASASARFLSFVDFVAYWFTYRGAGTIGGVMNSFNNLMGAVAPPSPASSSAKRLPFRSRSRRRGSCS